MNSRLFHHMAETHDLYLTDSEEADIMSAALDNYDAERVKQGQRIAMLEAEAQADRNRCDLAEKETDQLRVALIQMIHMTERLGELHDESQEDTEDVDHILSNGDCRRIAEAVGKAKVTLEDCAP